MPLANQERALRKSETRINAELSDLDKSIIVKEALLLQIKEGQASFATMQKVTDERRAEVKQHCSGGSSLVFCILLLYLVVRVCTK